MTSCEDIRVELPALLDGELSGAERDRVQRHVEDCARCRQEVLAFRDTWSLLDQAPAEKPDPGYVDRFWREAGVPSEGVKSSRMRYFAVAACIVVISGLLLRFVVLSSTSEDQTGQDMAELPSISVPEDAASPDRPETEAGLLPTEDEIIEDLEMLEHLDFLAALGDELDSRIDYGLESLFYDGEEQDG